MIDKMSRDERRQMLINHFVGWCVMQMTLLAQASGFLRQYFHGVRHPYDLFVGALRLAKCHLGAVLPQWVIDLLWMGAWGHDLVQDADATLNKDGLLVRQRKRGPNEDDTAKLVVAELRRLRAMFGEDTISDEEIELIKVGIELTYPDFTMAEGIIQPRLTKYIESKDWLTLPVCVAEVVPVSIGQGDLLMMGHQPHVALGTSRSLVPEENPWIDEMLRNAGEYQGNIDPVLGKKALKVFRGFDGFQKTLFERRFQQFRREVSYFRPEVQEEIWKNVRYFEAAGVRCQWRADEYLPEDQYSVEELCKKASDFGFKDVPYKPGTAAPVA
jgi:hypothetical protein